MKNLKSNSKALDKIVTTIEELLSIEKEISVTKSQIHDKKIDLSKISVTIESHERNIGSLRREIEAFRKTVEPKIEFENLNIEISEKKAKKKEFEKQKEIFDIVVVLLKDNGIKSKIIAQYVPIINKLINKYLASFDFLCEFNLDENFNEIIRSRFRDEFQYGNFSEGEKQKINLSVLFAWRALSKLRNSLNTNLLIMDEICDGSADGNTIELLFDLLNTEMKNQNIFIISHREEMKDKFSHVIEFQKTKNFSNVKGT